MCYSLKESAYKGNPTLEILRDGQPWGADRFGAEHFSFGITKARMIRAALPVIEKFVQSLGGQPWPGQTQTFSDFTMAGTIFVLVEKFDDFQRADDQPINQPYLKLTSGQTSLGLGTSKCEAVLALWPKIEAFLRSNFYASRTGPRSI